MRFTYKIASGNFFVVGRFPFRNIHEELYDREKKLGKTKFAKSADIEYKNNINFGTLLRKYFNNCI